MRGALGQRAIRPEKPIDFYGNYMTNFHDNAVEIDGEVHNARVMRNTMLNSASHPFRNQPSLGGPTYWIRNVVYHAPSVGIRGQCPLEEQPDARRERRALDSQRRHHHEVQFLGL